MFSDPSELLLWIFILQGKSALREAETARIMLKILETLTYSCEDVQVLVKLNKALDETVATFKRALPNTEGLIIRKEAACKATAKFKALKLQKVVEKEGFGNLKLYTQRGRKRLDSSYRNRVGQRAARLQKVFSSLDMIMQCRKHHVLQCYRQQRPLLSATWRSVQDPQIFHHKPLNQWVVTAIHSHVCYIYAMSTSCTCRSMQLNPIHYLYQQPALTHHSVVNPPHRWDKNCLVWLNFVHA